jgi:hypothetical protein
MTSDLEVRETPDSSLPRLYEQASRRNVYDSGHYSGVGQKWKNEPSVHEYGHHVTELPGVVPNYGVAEGQRLPFGLGPFAFASLIALVTTIIVGGAVGGGVAGAWARSGDTVRTPA